MRRGTVVGDFSTPIDEDAVLGAAHGLDRAPSELPG
jgi:hypothetical protein